MNDMCPFCKSGILPGQTTFPKEYFCGTLLYENGHRHQFALCAAWEELIKLRTVAEESIKLVSDAQIILELLSDRPCLPVDRFRKNICESIEALKKAGYWE